MINYINNSVTPPVLLIKIVLRYMPYLSTTPLTLRAYNKLRLADLIIGISPLRFHRAAPIACDGFITLGLWLGRSIIIPVICHRIPIRAADSLKLQRKNH